MPEGQNHPVRYTAGQIYIHIKCTSNQDLMAQLHLCAVDDAWWDQSPCRTRNPHPVLTAAQHCCRRIQNWRKWMPVTQLRYRVLLLPLFPDKHCHRVQTHTTLSRFVIYILFSFFYKQENPWTKTIRINQTPTKIHQVLAVRMRKHRLGWS